MVDRTFCHLVLRRLGSHRVTYTPIGNLGVTGVSITEYPPGLGLYGTDGRSAGYLINETTGQASLLAPLSGISALFPMPAATYAVCPPRAAHRRRRFPGTSREKKTAS